MTTVEFFISVPEPQTDMEKLQESRPVDLKPARCEATLPTTNVPPCLHPSCTKHTLPSAALSMFVLPEQSRSSTCLSVGQTNGSQPHAAVVTRVASEADPDVSSCPVRRKQSCRVELSAMFKVISVPTQKFNYVAAGERGEE